MSRALKILASHPVQYHAPIYRQLAAAGLDIEVGYYHQGTAGRAARDIDFGLDIEWDVDLLSGYPHRFFYAGEATYSRSEQLRIMPQLMRWALSERTTPLMLVGWFAEVIWLVWLACIAIHKPTLQLCETTLLSFAATPKPRWRTALLAQLLQRTHAGLYIGQRNREFLINMGMKPERLARVPYSVDNDFLASESRRLMPRRRDLCAQYGLDPDLPVFVFCGKLIPKKRSMQLLEAYLAADLKETGQLLLVGDGLLRQEIEDRVRSAQAKHICLLGFLNQTQMPLAYVLGEVLCLISDATETWGLVVNEASACGRPVIVTDTIGCSPDLVTPANGWTVPLDDHAALVRTLREAYQRRAEWPAMGSAGQAIAASHTFTQMAAGIETAVTRIKLHDSEMKAA